MVEPRTMTRKKAEPGSSPEGISMRLVLDHELHRAVRRAAANDNKSMSRFLKDLIGAVVMGREPKKKGPNPAGQGGTQE